MAGNLQSGQSVEYMAGVFKRLSKFLVTIKTHDVEQILAPFYFLLSQFLLIPLEAFYQQL